MKLKDFHKACQASFESMHAKADNIVRSSKDGTMIKAEYFAPTVEDVKMIMKVQGQLEELDPEVSQIADAVTKHGI